MKNNGKVKELVSIIKLARKYSLLGEYGYSLEKYQEAISIIKQRQEEIVNEKEDIKEKWKMTEYNIKSEMLQIKDILQTCLQLHHSEFSYSKKQNEGNYYLMENKKIIEKEIFDIFSKDKKLYEKDIRNNNKNTYSGLNKQAKNKLKSKSTNVNNNFNMSSKNNNKISKIVAIQENKNYSDNKYNSASYSNKRKNLNVKKSISYKEPPDIKMFNPLEQFYGHKLNDNEILNINKEQNLNGLEKINSKNYNINDKNVQNKKIKIVSIDLDGENIDKNKIINNKNKINNNNFINEVKINNNVNMVEQAMKNFSNFNLDNTDDSIY